MPGAPALAAWGRLQEQTNALDETDIATFRMLPMIYRNLRNSGLEEDEMGPLKGIYRQWWLRTRLTLNASLRAEAALRATGFEPVALKGLGLIATAYSEAALRPMHDVDLLLRPGQFVAAATALMARGWRPLRGTKADFFRRARLFHALPVVNADGLELDLHRYMLEENCYAGADTTVFDRLVRANIGEATITTLSPEDHVINACVHGVRWDPVPPLRWVLDAVMAIRGAESRFDWEYVVGEARRRRVSVGMGAALAYAAEFEPSIPAATLEALQNVPSSRLERWDFAAQQGGYRVDTQLARYLTRYLRLSAHHGPFRRAIDFPTYLECMWELDRPRQVPLDGARRTWKAVRKR